MSGRAELLSGWVQVLASLGILIGLILVIVELRQAKQLVYAETATQMYSDILDDNRSIMGEEAYKTIYRGCVDPDSLQGQDLFLLHFYLQSQLISIERLRTLEFIADFGTPWEELALSFVQNILASEFGRRWYKTVRGGIAPEIAGIADYILENEAYLDCGKFVESLTAETKIKPAQEPNDA